MEIDKKEIVVDVAYYDAAEKEKFSKFPTFQKMQEITLQGSIVVPTAEFLTYYLFHRKRLGIPGYLDYRSISQNINDALNELSVSVKFNAESICTAPNVQQQLPHISEHIGEGIGLSVLGQIHNLSQADWDYIKPGGLPSFDFQTASDGNNIIQVENKGSSVADNTILSDPIYNHKYKIAQKKGKLHALAIEKKDPHPATLRYGTITAMDPRNDGHVKCWLLDPPPEPEGLNPKIIRLLTRLKYIGDWISFISPRSQLASAIASRIADLRSMTNPFELDGVPLQRNTFSVFEIYPSEKFYDYSSFFASKSRIIDGRAGGIVLQPSDKYLCLIGFREELLIMAAGQKFEGILKYYEPPATVYKEIECIFSPSRYSRLRLPARIKEKVEKRGNYYSLRSNGQVHYGSGGTIFAFLPIDWEDESGMKEIPF